MVTSLPAAVNWCPNPSFETNTTGWTAYGSGVTLTRETGWSWAGLYGGRVVLTATAGTGVALASGSLVSAVSRTLAAASVAVRVDTAGVEVRLRLESYDSGKNLLGSSSASDLGSFSSDTGSQRLTASYVLPAGTAYVGVRLERVEATATEFWFDGVDLRLDAAYDTYVDGSLGSGYYWQGTAHASASTRSSMVRQETAFTGGVVTIQPRLFRATISNQLLEDVTNAFLDGSIEVDIDRIIKLTSRWTFDRKGVVEPFSDYLAVFLRMEWENGEVFDEQIGLFTLETPSEEFSALGYRAEIPGNGVTFLLEESVLRNNYIIAAGTKYTAAARDLVASVGLSSAIPDDSRIIPAGGLTIEAGVSKLEAVNGLLQSVNMYNCWATRDGRVTSMPYRSLAATQPSRTYGLGDSGEILGSLRFDRNTDNIRNVVVVVKDDPAGTILRAERVNNSPANPASVVNLGRERARYVYDSSLADQTAVDRLADRLIQELGVYVSAEAQVFPDPLLDIHDVVYLDLAADPGLSSYGGKYWVASQTFGLKPDNAAMTLRLRRVEGL